jgi:hypothetical protein
MNLQKIFADDERIVSVREYLDGWVANAYRYPAPGRAVEHFRDGNFAMLSYDRKRKNGRGPSWVAKSAKGGTLKTG